MKKSLLILVSALALASCAKVKTVEPVENAADGPMRFALSSQNMTKAATLQQTGIYNFGVFAYKSTEPTYNLMDNYLVGYMDATNKQGYYMTSDNQTTLGDVPGAANGSSMWAYEKMGNTEYSYTGAEGYYTTADTRYMSNVDKQYLRYWDKSADYTMFYAYTPYQNASFTGLAAVSYNNSTKTMTIPGGTIHDGYNNPTDNEFMFASAKVVKANYGQDVPLQFKHLVAKCNIKFYEEIDGYSVRILNLSNSYGGVYAVPAIESAPYQYTLGSYYKTSGASIKFDDEGNTVSQTNAVAHDLTQTTEALQFAAPIENAIGTTNATASASPTTYYAIPKEVSTGGFTFHVSYELTSTTGERITVHNATVWVPADKCAWQANKHYTYVFKITKNSNGTTDDPETIDPLDPGVSGDAALLPIIFDNCTVEEWDIIDGGEYNIADANTKYFSIKLDKGSIVRGASENTITATLLERGTAVTSATGAWTLKKPGVADPVSLTTANPKTVAVAVGSDWTVGEYTLIFTPDASMGAPNAKYETKFYVIDAYTVSLNAAEVGTRGTAESILNITTDANAYKAGYLSIEYPAGVTSGDDKNKVRIENRTEGLKVVVKKEAVPGDYKIVYTVDGDKKSEFEFKVVDYALNTGITGNSVGLSQSTQEFNVTSTASSTTPAASKVYTITAPAGADADQVTFDSENNKIKVTKDATVGQYTLKLVVDNGGTKTTYVRTFEVKNVYKLEIFKGTTECYLVDNDDPTDSTPVTLTVKATKNGAEDTTTELGFTTMTGVSLSGRTITILRNGTPNNYIVSWVVDGKTVAAATLVVTD